MTFMEFESLEAAQEWMRRQEQAANERLTPEQRSIGWGDYWVRLDHDFEIWGEVWTEEYCLKSEIEAGATRAEAKYSMTAIKDAHERGYRFGMAWSVVEPRGEIGSTHVANMMPCSEALFEAARTCEWDLKLNEFHALVKLGHLRPDQFTAWVAKQVEDAG